MGKIITGLVLLIVSLVLPIGIIRVPLLLVGLSLLIWGFILVLRGPSVETSTTDSFGAGFAYAFECNKSGIALSTDKKVVKLKSKQLTKEYPFSSVREWSTNLAFGGDIVHTGGGSLASAMAVAGANAQNRKRNRADSGLFVTVKDIDNPVWRIEMLDKKSQQRWMEIMQQCINEV